MKTDEPHNCQTCGHQTDAGRAHRAKQYREHPIYNTDLRRKKSVIINEIRSRIVAARGAISDFQFGFPGWRERTEPVEGALTCCISSLYHVIAELEKFEQQNEQPKEAQP